LAVSVLDHWFFQKLAQPLVLFGIAGQCLFMLRFVVQWFASERRGRSYIPIAFWYFSLGGGGMVLTYGILDHDPVIMLGQSLGIAIYLRTGTADTLSTEGDVRIRTGETSA
jgi:lipid-A-disaccharide synthase-like uncharacterized protein